MNYPIHPDFAGLRLTAPLTPAMMRLAAPVMRFALRCTPVPPQIAVTRFRVAGRGKRRIPTEVYVPRAAAGPLPCLLYFHGGAFCFPAAPPHKKLLLRYARELGCAVVFPDYALLPHYPYPAAQEDALDVCDWLLLHAQELGVDQQRLAVGGDSAGGPLAAAVCAHLKGALRLQMLIYPVLDARQQTDSMRRFTDTPLWNARQNGKMWALYLGGAPQAQCADASPMLAPLPPHIPDTYLETAEFDCLHDEGVAYARRLEAAGGRVTLCETKGTVHGYDMLLRSAVTEESVRRRIAALREGFGTPPEDDAGQQVKR